jgi:uncharacterized protein YgiM (DUF1202 family)
MSDRYGSYPPDEPVIGASYPPASPGEPDEPYIGGSVSAPYYDDDNDDAGYDDEYYDDDQYEDDDGYYDDAYYEDAPARQPMFYVFIGAAALIGGVVIFLLFTLLSNGGGSSPAATAIASGFSVLIDSPTQNARIETNKPTDVMVRAKATEPITRFQLLVGTQIVDNQPAPGSPAADGTYSITLKLPAFSQKGENKILVRVTAQSGHTKDSDPVNIVVIEPVGDKPLFVKGKVVADATIREGPGDDFPVVDTLTAGTDVKILGKTRDATWLLLDIDNGRWVKRNAIQEQDSLDLVPVKDPTPVPQPTATNTPVPSPAPTASPTPNASAPDFFVAGATLTDGGSTLQVTVGNQSTNSYTGPLVVSAGGVTAGTLTLVFNVNIPANGSTTVNFDISPAVTTEKTVNVKVDPDNAIKEAHDDNNNATFPLKPAVESPKIVISNIDPSGAAIAVSIKNNGGPLTSAKVTVRVTIGGNASEQSKTIALTKGQDSAFTITKPGSGAGATVEVLIDGTVVQTQTDVTIP